MTRSMESKESIEWAYIGETASVIFLPVLPGENALQDGVNGAMKYHSDAGQYTSLDADLIRYANLPKAVQDRWETQEMVFWTPAFKVRPRLFLLLAGMLTISPPDNIARDRLRFSPVYPVTLPLSEAEESLKTVLVSLMISKRHLFDELGDITIRAEESELIFLPFTPREMNLSMKVRILRFQKRSCPKGKIFKTEKSVPQDPHHHSPSHESADGGTQVCKNHNQKHPGRLVPPETAHGHDV